ncbi:hypothetical protein [Streptomyces cupreus]|uniref:Uncharacterized protein n=1 Tax=Streptomyces cupreus TaxID=2759956 RepID=A0A7X1J4I6_9ACTN|nr:hypothetical protein [Streptomyces cupreus]MBC2904019.1 hypothetical protein [Streptomyces cupreus]
MPQPWTTPHELRVFKQWERRPDGASGWMEAQPTGQVHLLCNCGYSTGWIQHEQMPSREQLVAEHGEPLGSIMR